MTENATILYIDKEVNNLNIFRAHFRIKGYKIYTCTSFKEGAEVIRMGCIQVAVIDQPSPDMTGLEFLEMVTTIRTRPAVISVTAHRDFSLIEKIFREGKIFCFHGKPWDIEELGISIEQAYKDYLRKLR